MSSYNFQNDYNIPAFLRRSKKVGVSDGGSQVPAPVASENRSVALVQSNAVPQVIEQVDPKLLAGPG